MKYTNLSLVLTDRCTAACDFCGFSCGPDRRQVMPEELMTRMIRESAEMGFKCLGFSGGEPFLYPELLIEGAQLAHELGMRVVIASNGFWGAWDKARIRDTLEKIKPSTVSFSYDFFHRKYVSEEALRQAVGECRKLDINAPIYVADMLGEYSAGRFIQSLDNLTKYGTSFKLYPAYRCGRAANLPEDMFLSLIRRDNLTCQSARTLSVLFNADVYPCCQYQVLDSQLKLGNVEGKALKAVVEGSDVPKVCDVLMNNERFNRLLELAGQEGIEIPEKVSGACDYCRMLFGTKENREKMQPHVEALYGEMVVASLLREAGIQ